MLQPNEIDQIKEVINIGTGNAFKSLGQLINRVVFMDVPEPHVDSIEKVQQQLGNSSEQVIAIYLQLSGDISGALLLTLPQNSAFQLSKILDPNNPNEQSVFTEVGNILLGTAATAFSQFLSLQLQHSIPDIATDMKGAVIQAVLLETSGNRAESLGVKVDLIVENEPIRGDVYYFFDEESSKKIISKTKNKIE